LDVVRIKGMDRDRDRDRDREGVISKVDGVATEGTSKAVRTTEVCMAVSGVDGGSVARGWSWSVTFCI
jgi:hypothetical protein